jgi:hypothetical protein
MMRPLALEADETEFGFALEPAGEVSALGGMHNASKLISYRLVSKTDAEELWDVS